MALEAVCIAGGWRVLLLDGRGMASAALGSPGDGECYLSSFSQRKVLILSPKLILIRDFELPGMKISTCGAIY